MNNRYQRMDEFLKFIAKIYDKNPNVYGTLVRYGAAKMSNEDEPLKNFFDGWINHFRDFHNINVFVSENSKYFCQFTNGRFNDLTPAAVKIYIPLDFAHIEQGAKMIFEFIESRGFIHASKIGKEERVDNIVIRVENEKVADEISMFVNSNSYIKEGLMPCNPFCITDGNICFAADNMLSFNSLLSNYIDDYMHNFHNSPHVGLEHFRSFLMARYNDYFVNGKYLEILENSVKTDLRRFNGDSIAALLNHQQVTELIMKSLDPKASANDFLVHINELRKEENSKEKYNNLSRLRGKEVKSPTLPLDETEIVNETGSRIEVLCNIIRVNCNKYGISHTCNAIRKYMDTGNASSFTRDYDTRKNMLSFASNEIVSMIQNYLGVEFNSNSFIPDFVKQVNEMDYLKAACNATFKKYGMPQTAGALIRFIRDNNAESFTNDYSARSNLKANVIGTTLTNKILKVLIINGIIKDINEAVSIEELSRKYVDFITTQYEIENKNDFGGKR